jgi:signal transduction histidine kinase/ActR/RegA family two-component response regulator
MRGTERTRRIPIIFLTAGAADSQRRFRGYETGAVDFINKPIEADILRSKADVFFDLYRQRQQVASQRDRLQEAQNENYRLLEESRQYAEALKEADARKDEFLATLAHELRNPLAPIRNGLQILSKSPDEQVAHETRDMMDRQLSHMVRLVDDLLDMSRISKGKIELRTERVSLNKCIVAAFEASRPLIEAGQHRFVRNTPEDVILEADETRISQVISNLLNNAAKYTPAGGTLTLTTQKQNGMIAIKVSDNGLGIPADMQPRIFDIFTQVNRNMEYAQGGLGIGLALVKRLVTMHGGTISVESAGANQGSTFTLTLPFVGDAAPAADVASQETVDAPVHPLRFLVVDDNVASAKTMGWSLEMMGYEYNICYDGMVAIDVAKSFKPDVILLDIGLPTKNGYDICRELRADPQFANTIIIAQTGWGQERDRQMAEEAGFNYHLVKPVDFDKLSNIIRNVQAARSKRA